MNIYDIDQSLRLKDLPKSTGSISENNLKEEFGVIEMIFTDGTSKNIRYGTLPRNPIKSLLLYFIRRGDIETLKTLKTIDGKDVRPIVRKILGLQESFQVLEASDVEFQTFMSKVKHKYPDSKDKQEAFMRYVHHELEHGLEDDDSQDRKLANLEKEIEGILVKLNKLSLKIKSTNTEPSLIKPPPKVEPIGSPLNLNTNQLKGV